MTLQRLENKPVPKLEDLTEYDYGHILGLSQNQRHKYYTYLFKTHNSDRAELVCACILNSVYEMHKNENLIFPIAKTRDPKTSFQSKQRGRDSTR